MTGATAATLVITLATASKIRKTIFGFPTPVHIGMSDLMLQRERMDLYTRCQWHHPTIREPNPADTEKMSEKDFEEHPRG